jgi:DnaK suppressor protein
VAILFLIRVKEFIMSSLRKQYFRDLFQSILTQSEKDGAREVNSPMGLTDLIITPKGDDADRSSAEGVTSIDRKLRWRRALYLKKIRQALLRLDRDDFGECHDCGLDIEEQRLMARPTATLCLSCKEDQEQIEGSIIYSKRSHTSGKSIDNTGLVGKELNLSGDESSSEGKSKALKVAQEISVSVAEGL